MKSLLTALDGSAQFNVLLSEYYLASSLKSMRPRGSVNLDADHNQKSMYKTVTI